MLPLTLAFALGNFILQLLPNLPNSNYWYLIVTSILLGAGICLWVKLKSSENFFYNLCQYSLCLILGFSWTLWHAEQVLKWHFPNNLASKIITAQGTINSIPENRDHYVTFIFAANKINNQPVTTNLSLACYNNCPDFQVGETWRLQVKLKPTHATLNPGTNDREAYWFSKQIRATGYVVTKTPNLLLQKINYSFSIDYLRSKLNQAIVTTLTNKPFAGIISALVTGERSNITPQQWQTFRATGTVHFLAIAGLHVGFVASIVFFLSRWLLAFSYPKLFLLIPASEIASLLAFIAALIYSALAGFALPTIRAVTMFGTITLLLLLRRNLSVWQIYATALLLILFSNPLASLTSGFWLSFSAVAIIFYNFTGRIRLKTHRFKITTWISKYFNLQFALTLGLLPLSLWFFQQASLIALVANALAIPWIGFLVMPLSLAGGVFLLLPHFAWAAHAVLYLAERAMAAIFWVLTYLSQLPFTNIQLAINNYWILLVTIVGALLLLAPKNWPARYLGGIYFLPLFFYLPLKLRPGEFNFTLLDVGQGLASVVTTAHHTLIYDTGLKFNDDLDSGNLVLLPFLRHYNLQRIDTLMVSHGDSDHIGGADTLIANMPVQQILTSVPERFINPPATYCYAGQHWQWDGVNFSVLFPPRTIYSTKNSPFINNNASCTLKVSNGYHSILLTGDLEKLGENLLLQTNPHDLTSEVLQAPHHGSINAADPTFLSTIKPQFVLFPIGFDNRFHFPEAKALQIYQQTQATLFDTATSGAITLHFPNNAEHPQIDRYRLSQQHYWRD